MRKFVPSSLLVGLMICGLGAVLAPRAVPPFAAQPALAAGPNDGSGSDWVGADDGTNFAPGTILHLPGMPPIHIGPDGRVFSDSAQGVPVKRRVLKPSLSPEQRAKAAKAEALKRAREPQKTHAEMRAELLGSLFKRLVKADDPGEANGIAQAIERVWLHSDSPTASLLMTRALAALHGGHLPLALTLFDQIVTLQPTWAEAWDKRAATRLLGGDLNGAVADMRRALKLEPRQFLALAALGFTLARQGFDKEALAAFRKSLALNPQQPDIKAIVDKLSIKVEGRDI